MAHRMDRFTRRHLCTLGLVAFGLAVLVLCLQQPSIPRAESEALYLPAATPPPVVKQFEETSYYLKDVEFVSADVGWIPQPAGVVATLRNVQFLDANTGWAQAAKNFPNRNIFLIHTTYGGSHWS